VNHGKKLGFVLCWAVVFADIGTSVYYTPGILFNETGKLAPGRLVHRKIPLGEAGDVLASMDRFATVGVTVIDRYDA